MKKYFLFLVLTAILFSNCNNKIPNKESQTVDNSIPGSEKNSDIIEISSDEVDWESIEKDLDRRFKHDSLSIQDKVRLAWLKSKFNKNQEAIKILSNVIESEKTDCSNYYDRAEIYLKVGSYSKSIQDLNTVLTLCPDNFRIYRLRGNAFLKNKQFKEAIYDLNKYFEYAPFYDTEALYMRAVAYYSIKDFEAACTDVKRAGYSEKQLKNYPKLQKCLD